MKDNNTTIDTSHFPKEWPGAFAIYRISRDRVRGNLGVLVMLALLPIVTNLVIGIILGRNGKDVANLISFLLSAYFAVVGVRAYLATAQRKTIELEPSLQFPLPLYWRMLGLNILVALTVVGGVILLIVPGIIFAMRLSAASYFLVDKNLGIMDAYKASWNATRGHLGKLWGLLGVGLLMLLPAITIVGIVATVYFFFMFGAAGALFYMHLLKNPPKETDEA